MQNITDLFAQFGDLVRFQDDACKTALPEFGHQRVV